jgi:hypothetical protein
MALTNELKLIIASLICAREVRIYGTPSHWNVTAVTDLTKPDRRPVLGPQADPSRRSALDILIGRDTVPG